LMAPVRLRAVASGLMMEKVRSIAMISSLKSADGSCGLISVRPVHGKRRDGLEWGAPACDGAQNYDDFT
jgi:hypothetical protein